jgi:hypothetical protein
MRTSTTPTPPRAETPSPTMANGERTDSEPKAATVDNSRSAAGMTPMRMSNGVFIAASAMDVEDEYHDEVEHTEEAAAPLPLQQPVSNSRSAPAEKPTFLGRMMAAATGTTPAAKNPPATPRMTAIEGGAPTKENPIDIPAFLRRQAN